MAPGGEVALEPASFSDWLKHQLRAQWFLWLGLAAFVVPTMISIARTSWSTEQGAHGPIVLATGIWLIARSWKGAFRLARPGSLPLALAMLVPCLIVYAAAIITGIVEIQGFAMYGALLAVIYAVAGGALMRHLWFPILYLGFVFPLPDQAVVAITQPLKIGISQAAVWMLYQFGYPIGGSGVTIQIAQYQLLVAAACAGLNSLISLTAIGLFYVYVRHNANWRYALLMMLAIIPAAIFANFVRVVILILITYYLGDAAAQGFMHNFAGLTMFVAAVLAVFAVDAVVSPLRSRLGKH